MNKVPILNHEIFGLYWRRNLQLRTPNLDVIRIFLVRASERGDSLGDYHANSNFCPKYEVSDLLAPIMEDEIKRRSIWSE